MIKSIFIVTILLFAISSHGAPHTKEALENSEKISSASIAPVDCLRLAPAVRIVDGKLEVTEEQAQLLSSGRIPCHTYTPPPPPPPPTRCPCQCTDYMTAVSQCKGYSFSQCWLIGPPKCPKGKLSCCC